MAQNTQPKNFKGSGDKLDTRGAKLETPLRDKTNIVDSRHAKLKTDSIAVATADAAG